MPLLFEVSAICAQVPGKNEGRQKFAEVAKCLKTEQAVKLPWLIDGKHCRDGFKLLMESGCWKTAYWRVVL